MPSSSLVCVPRLLFIILSSFSLSSLLCSKKQRDREILLCGASGWYFVFLLLPCALGSAPGACLEKSLIIIHNYTVTCTGWKGLVYLSFQLHTFSLSSSSSLNVFVCIPPSVLVTFLLVPVKLTWQSLQFFFDSIYPNLFRSRGTK